MLNRGANAVATSTVKEVLLVAQQQVQYLHRLVPGIPFSGRGDGKQPCNPGGGSPSLHKANPRVTGPLFTGRDCLLVCNCGLTSVKSISTLVGVPRRVERPSLEICTKGIRCHRGPSLISSTSSKSHAAPVSVSPRVERPGLEICTKGYKPSPRPASYLCFTYLTVAKEVY